MKQRKDKLGRKKATKKKKSPSIGLGRLTFLVVLLLVLLLSVGTAGYVIFFRTVLVLERPTSGEEVGGTVWLAPPKMVDAAIQGRNRQVLFTADRLLSERDRAG